MSTKLKLTGGRPISQEKVPRILALRRQGISYLQIAKELGVSKTTVKRYCNPEIRQAAKERRARPEIRGRRRARERTTKLRTKDKTFRGLNKRLWPGKCELCTVEGRLGYHHWDDNNPSLGIWICIRCHQFVEFVEDMNSGQALPYMKRYLELKEKVSREEAK